MLLSFSKLFTYDRLVTIPSLWISNGGHPDAKVETSCNNGLEWHLTPLWRSHHHHHTSKIRVTWKSNLPWCQLPIIDIFYRNQWAMVLGAWHGFIRGPGVSEEDFHSRKDNAEFQPFLVCRYVLFVSPMFAIISRKLCNLAFIAACCTTTACCCSR